MQRHDDDTSSASHAISNDRQDDVCKRTLERSGRRLIDDEQIDAG